MKVSIYTISPVQVRVEYDMNFESRHTVRLQNRRPRLIGANGRYSSKDLVKLEEIGDHLKADGSLVFVVWMNYRTLSCTWTGLTAD